MCVLREHSKSVFVVLRVNCGVLTVQSPVCFECVLPEFAQTTRGGKSSRPKAWQSSVMLTQTDKARALTKAHLTPFGRGYCVCLVVLALLVDVLTSRARSGESCGTSGWTPSPRSTTREMPLGVERHLCVVIGRAVVNIGCFALCH